MKNKIGFILKYIGMFLILLPLIPYLLSGQITLCAIIILGTIIFIVGIFKEI